MKQIVKTISVIAMLAASAPGFAQTTEEESAESEAPDPLALSMGSEDIAVGDVYLEGEYKDWEVRCIKEENGNDPCQLYQLLADPSGNPIAEINIFPIGGEGQPAAGATVITPLETLLTQQLGMSVDGGAMRKYPFSWCSQVGCYSRLGMSEADVAAFRKGVNANLIIVPVIAPDQKINLRVSLSGFTSGFQAVKELMDSRKN